MTDPVQFPVAMSFEEAASRGRRRMRLTHGAVVLALFALAAEDERSPDEIFEVPTQADRDFLERAVAFYVDRGIAPAAPFGEYEWGEFRRPLSVLTAVLEA